MTRTTDTPDTTRDRYADAERSADGWLESLIELYRAWCEVGEVGRVEIDGAEYTDEGELCARAQEKALEVTVSTGWHLPGEEEPRAPVAYRILISTGGPALRIAGDLHPGGYPGDHPRVEVQDWYLPWREYLPTCATGGEYWAALDWFVMCFYYGA